MATLNQASLSTIFPKAFAHFASLCHILVVLAIISNLFIIIILVVISDAITVNTSGNHDPCPCKTLNLIKVVCGLTAPPTSFSPIFFLSPHSPYFLIHKNTESRSNNNPTLASKHSRERKSCTFFPSFKQKLQMVKLSEEAILKAEISQKLGLLH